MSRSCRGLFPPCVYTPAAGGALTASHPVTAAPGRVGQCAKFRHRPVTAASPDLSHLPGQRWWTVSGPGTSPPGGKGMTCRPVSPRARALVCTCCPALSLIPCLIASGCDCQTVQRWGAHVLGRAPGGGCMWCEGPEWWLLWL